MNKRILAWVLTGVVLLAAVISFGLFLQRQEPSDMWKLCAASAASAAEDFREFARSGEETDWWSAVAEFRSFMQSYHFLQGESNAEYIWCNSVYGYLLLEPDRAGDQAEALAQAMELLALDPENINGFEIVSRINNALIHGE